MNVYAERGTRYHRAKMGALRRLATLLNVPMVDTRSQGATPLLHAAADEIERLRGEREDLLQVIEQLKPFATPEIERAIAKILD